MQTFLRREKKIVRYLIAGFIIVALLIGLIFIAVSNLRQEAIQTHRHIANLHAYTLEEHFSQTLQHISLTMDRLAPLSHEEPSQEGLSSIFSELLHNAPYLRSLSLLDEKGAIIASSHEPNIGEKISLEHFLPIPFGETPLLRIGLPWEGRDFDVARESSIQNPVRADAISFLPLLKKVSFEKRPYFVIANLNMDYLTNRYTYTLPLEQGSLTLWRIDGILLFSSDPNTLLGSSHYSKEHPKDNDDFFTHIGMYEQPALNVFRLAKVLPFMVEIHTNEANALDYWDNERQKVLGITTLLIVFSGALALALIVRYYKENERQRAQLSYEKQFRVAMEATQTGLWTWDFKINRIAWDPQCFLLLGLEPGVFEPSWDKIFALTHPEDALNMRSSIQEQIRAHSSFLIERRMKTANELWVWIQVRGKVIEWSKEHEPTLLTGVYINIDAQKRAEQLHLSAVAFETQEAILITDAKERVVKVNEAFTRITGYREQEMIGKTPRILKSDKHDNTFYESMWKGLLEHGYWQGELWNKRKNGEIYAESITITAIRDAKGKTTHYIANFNDITTHKAAQQQIQALAYYDPLTHLANRRLLDETLEQTIRHSIEERHFGALLFIDLDHFKELNDTHGHDAGDMLLIQTASRLKESIRESDMVARLGGDEFIVLLKNLGTQKGIAEHLTQSIAKKILALLCEPYALAHGNYLLGASIGCTIFGTHANIDGAMLIKEADIAMYQAKESGRSTICFYGAQS
ncbi:diguanylate cyclase domain-containing protein [Sulfurospirillum multivorans]|uniref:Diguanylate cyclase/phosphodiesterase n=2 Tax=Sulfurospirillum multivorans TaxID=66821 RepID=A0AA86E3R4_SULMK|nr:diguanylate cyclase [Sulfurospirillum multivorans]AHJ14097.1 diguanylate cyclase/phosphodiesterase [Sulfurospirillum multivorans DSM 12446]QEH07584.1 diguanylate cyclase/phosphodiesterase [Sulfurospirillum multivorans]